MTHQRHMRAVRAFLAVAGIVALAAACSVVASSCAPAQADVQGGVVRNPVVSSLMNDLDRSDLEPTIDDLTGETAPLIGGSPYRILTRFAKAGEPSDMAEQYVYEHLLSYGLTSVSYQTGVANDGVTYRNVIGEIVGKRHPEEVVVVGAHLDSISGAQSAIRAPGADDDGSGVAATMYLAKVFAGREFDRTIRFVFFDSEESLHIGAVWYVDRLKANREDVVAMFAADMFAHHSGSEQVEIHTREPGTTGEPADRALARLFLDVADVYSVPAIKPAIIADGSISSDHQLFWEAGYPAVMVVEDLDQRNPLTHTPEDTKYNFVWPFYVGVAKALLGTVAHQAGLISGSSTSSTPTSTPVASPTPTQTPTPRPSTPSLSLRASPLVVKVGRRITLSGSVVGYRAGDTKVILSRTTGAGLKRLKSATLDSSGAFKTSMTATKTGRWALVATYRTGSAVFRSNTAIVSVRK